MAVSAKRAPIPLPPVAGVHYSASPAAVSLPAQLSEPNYPLLDFVPNPNRYRVSKKTEIGKSTPARAVDFSPRLLLELSLKCEVDQLRDPEFGE